MLVLAVRLRPGERSVAAAALTLLALALSCWVAVSASWGLVGQDVCVTHDYQLEYLCWYSPELSPLWHHLLFLPRLTTAQIVFALLTAAAFARLAFPFVRDLVPMLTDRTSEARRTVAEERW